MKKKLVVLLAVVMMFAFSASAYAVTFSDVADRPVVEQDAIKKAVALGIVNGYEDGTFGPDKTITRAEFAKIAVTAAGAEETATMLEGNASSFNDVRVGQWYIGWVNAAQSLGIMQGDGANFRPNDTISNQEAITVLMRLLGYNDNLTGNWPANYVTKANQINLLDDVSIVAAAAAKRGDVMVMLDATLDSDIVTYDKDTNEFVKKQVLIRGSKYMTLLEDKFDGSYLDVTAMPAVEQVRDASAKTLNWNVTGEYVKDDGTVGTQTINFIVDEDTAVSYNGETLFDLEGHQGKVYYVNDGNKSYARFVEVESYTVDVADAITYDGKKFNVKKTTYNKAYTVGYDTINGTVPATMGVGNYNSNYVVYFNEDDQIYLIKPDKSFDEKGYVVKGVSANNVRLIGNTNKTVSMNDNATLIYDGDKFVGPSELEVGDAVMEIVQGELYVLVDIASGTLNRTEYASSDQDGKYNIGGKNFVTPSNRKVVDKELEDSDATEEDILGNNVEFVLNKNNTVAVVIVDETSTGSTMYGIVTNGDSRNGSWTSGNLSSLEIFTEQGYTVTYDIDKDEVKTGATAQSVLGKLVAYKLNKDGEIKELKLVGTYTNMGTLNKTERGYALDGTATVEIKNNAYINQGATSLALASSAVIFEVDEDGNDVDVSLIARSSFLSKGDFVPEQIEVGSGNYKVQYFNYELNTNGAVKVMAYTKGSSNDLHYGVIGTWDFRSSDSEHSVTFRGDDNVYDLNGHITYGNFHYGTPTATGNAASQDNGGAGRLVAYTLSGDDVVIIYNFARENAMKTSGLTKEVSGVTNGLISFKSNPTPLREYNNDGTYKVSADTSSKYVVDAEKGWNGSTTGAIASVMTDSSTLVYIVDATDGTYSEGSVSDISAGDMVFVPVVDEDGYADLVIVDQYGDYSK